MVLKSAPARAHSLACSSLIGVKFSKQMDTTGYLSVCVGLSAPHIPQMNDNQMMTETRQSVSLLTGSHFTLLTEHPRAEKERLIIT